MKICVVSLSLTWLFNVYVGEHNCYPSFVLSEAGGFLDICFARGRVWGHWLRSRRKEERSWASGRQPWLLRHLAHTGLWDQWGVSQCWDHKRYLASARFVFKVIWASVKCLNGTKENPVKRHSSCHPTPLPSRGQHCQRVLSAGQPVPVDACLPCFSPCLYLGFDLLSKVLNCNLKMTLSSAL